MKRLAIFCGSSIGFNTQYAEAAKSLGKYMAKNNIGMVYGGGKIGMMGAIADSILEHQGEVIGVIPGLLKKEEVAHQNLSQLIVTKTMSERKVEISKLSDGYIALPGGFGTLDEIFEALTLNQLGIESKPIGILNTNGYFNATLNQLDFMVKEGFLKHQNRKMVISNSKIIELLKSMKSYEAAEVKHVISKVASR